MWQRGSIHCNGRFEILDYLGEGGMGTVFSALDHERRDTVALKLLRRGDPADVGRFKREFRSVSEVFHPNLVTLHELIAADDTWFFTMELVEGVDFLSYAWGSGERPRDNDSSSVWCALTGTQPGLDRDTISLAKPFLGTPITARNGAPRGEFSTSSERRLRSALRQLASGLDSLHQLGIVHRDIKPSNILVTPQNRLVILDFGVVRETGGNPLTGSGVRGTPAYMAPEQFEGETESASDWYAVGVMLYEALTGRLPFSGPVYKMFWDKANKDAVPPRPELALPDDLVELTMGLLARRASQRPRASDVEATLGVPARRKKSIRSSASQTIVGRIGEQERLHAAWEATRGGRPIRICISGPSGVGKSALTRRFLENLRSRGSRFALRAKCYPRESVPFKGLDGIMEALAVAIQDLPRSAREPLLAPDSGLLAELFPSWHRMATPKRPKLDPSARRHQAFEAVRGLLQRLSASHMVTICIDDLQWADLGTIRLLRRIMRPPDAPPLLLVLSFRSEAVASTPYLQQIIRESDGNSLRHIALESLGEADAGLLASHLLSFTQGTSDSLVRQIVNESGGSPFLIEQLSRHLDSVSLSPRKVNVSTTEMVNARLSALPSEAKSLLTTLAIAARPLEPSVAREAAGLHTDEHHLIHLLLQARLVRRSGSGRGIEIYHDKIRETLSSNLSESELRDKNRRLADTLRRRGGADPEVVFHLYAGAGQPEQAVYYGLLAANGAASSLAFENAASLFEEVLELNPQAQSLRLVCWLGIANALANQGKGHEAGKAFLRASDLAGEEEALDMRRRAAEEMLRSGHFDQGLRILNSVLSEFGLRVESSPSWAFVRTMARRAFLRVRGLSFAHRGEDEVSSSKIRLVDACWAGAIGLARIDTARAFDLQSQHLLLSLRSGEPKRIAQAFALEAGFLAAKGGASNSRRASELVEKSDAIISKLDSPESEAFVSLTRGVIDFYSARFEDARRSCQKATSMLGDERYGRTWERDTAQTYLLGSLYYQGALGELSRRVPTLLEEAEDRGDLYACVDLAVGRPSIAWLIRDDVEGARDSFGRAMASWSQQGYHFQHFLGLQSKSQLAFYDGNGALAWELVNRGWQQLGRSMFLRLRFNRVEAWYLRARAALLAAIQDPSRIHLLDIAEQDASRIERQQLHWSQPLANLIHGLVESARRKDSVAVSSLRAAADGFDEVGMRAFSTVARRRLGQLIGGDSGKKLLEESDEWMKREGVAHPGRLSRTIAPFS